MIRHLVLVSFLLTFSLCANSAEKKVNNNKSDIPDTVAPEELKSAQRDSIGNTMGVIVLNEHKEGDFIHIYNADGSLWYKFTFYNDDRNRKFPYRNEDFYAFAFHTDYFLLVLKCVGKEKGHYKVIVNEETGLTKYIRTDDPTMKFESWEEHILNTFAVHFNPEENPLLESPQGRVKKTDLSNSPFFDPIEVKGDWLKVRWETTKATKDKEPNYDFGWIRWKKDETLLVELFYFY